MTSPFPGHRAGFPPPPPGGTTPPPPPRPTAPPLSSPAHAGAPPPPQPPPPGYQAYEPWQGTHRLPRAGFGARLGAYLLDTLLYGLLASVLIVPGLVLLLSNSCESDAPCDLDRANAATIPGGLFLMLAGVVVVTVLYIRALGRTGQTWGRRIVGIKVVGKMTGQPIGIGAAIGRQLFAWMISGQVFYLGFLWMLWDDDRQTWHDKIADSIVVKL